MAQSNNPLTVAPVGPHGSVEYTGPLHVPAVTLTVPERDALAALIDARITQLEAFLDKLDLRGDAVRIAQQFQSATARNAEAAKSDYLTKQRAISAELSSIVPTNVSVDDSAAISTRLNDFLAKDLALSAASVSSQRSATIDSIGCLTKLKQTVMAAVTRSA